MKPQLAEDANLAKMIFPVWGQPKIDGVRGMKLKDTLTGRSLDPFKGFGVTERFNHTGLIGLDGELILGEDPCAPRLCSLTTGALGRFKDVTEVPDIHWWLFDYVTPDTLNLSYEKRYDILDEKYRHHLRVFEFLHLVTFEIVHNLQEANMLIAKHLVQNFEGTIWRQPGEAVKQGRSDKRQQLWRTKPWADMEILVTAVREGNENTNEAKINTLGRTERSSAKAGLVPNGQIGAVIGEVLEDFICPFSGRLLFPKGLVVEAGSGEMTEAQAAAWFQDPTQIVRQIAKIKHLAYGVKDLPRMGTFVSKRLPQDMS